MKKIKIKKKISAPYFNLSMQDLGDKTLSGNVCNVTWHLFLLPTLANDCLLAFQLSVMV